MTNTFNRSGRAKSALATLSLFAAIALGMAPASAASTIPVGTKFNCTLATQDINTKNAQPGDQFVMAVVEPYPNGNPRFAGAKVYGHVIDGTRSAGQGRTAILNVAFDKIVLADGEVGQVTGTLVAAHTVAENTTARKALGAGAGMAVGSQTIGRLLGGTLGGVVGTVGGAAAGYAYANNAKANFNLAKGASATIKTTEPAAMRKQARY